MTELLISILIWFLAGAAAFSVMGAGNKQGWKDILFGFIGAIVGGWLFSLLGIGVGYGLIGVFIVAFVGACLAIFIARRIFQANV